MRALSRVAASAWLVGGVTALLASACAEELGVPDYSGHADFVLDGGARPDSLPGPAPFIPGLRRLNVGLFYEGGFSDRYLLDDERLCLREPHVRPLRCYFIFVMPMTGELQYTQDTVADRIEGTLSDRITLTGTPFWGGGVVWDEPTDLSAWTVLSVALKSADPSFSSLRIEMQSGADAVAAFAVEATDYGFVNDGEWHRLSIPLSDFRGLDRRTVRSPFILSGTGSKVGDVLLVDEVYLSQD